MKKHKFIKIIILSCIVMFLTVLPVNAEEERACNSAVEEDVHVPKVECTNGACTVSVASEEFKVTVTGSKNYSNIDVNANQPFVFPYETNKNLLITVTFTLVTPDKPCTGKSPLYTVNIRKEAGAPVRNSNLEICNAFKNGVYNNYFTSIDRSDFTTYSYSRYKNKYDNYLSYCNSEYVEIDYSAELVKKMIKNAINTVKLEASLNSTNSITRVEDPSFEALWNSVPSGNRLSETSSTNFIDSSSLKCDPFSVQPLDGEDYYTNKKVYSKTSNEGSTSTCRKTCREVVTVKYGPPVASKAGLCFEYKVKIQSKVNCETEYTGGSIPTMGSYCNPVPHCNDSQGFEDQAGPNEDFDKCINSCDGGKYTQQCINSCYKKIYQNSNSSLKLSYQLKTNVVKLSQSSQYDMNAIFQKKQDNPGGSYVRESGIIKWVSSGNVYSYTNDNNLNNYIHKLSIYYFRDINETTRTIMGYFDEDYVGDGFVDTYMYIADKEGFKRAENCNETCSFGQCDNPNQFLNYQDALDDYNERLEDYINDRNNCSAQASCSTSTAEFTIKVNNKTNQNPNSDNWIEYDEATLIGKNNISDRDNIILDKGGCYGESSTEYDYMTEWSFPGTWINNKTGEIRYEPTNNSEWHKKKDKFCTSLDSKDVNTNWWKWKEVSTKDASYSLTEPVKQTIISEVNSNQNIEATVKNFGYFKWGFKINCFYALNSKPILTGDPGSVCVGDNCEEVSLDNYKFRNVTTANLFPGDNNLETSLTGRDPGFNYTALATNINNSEYEITPTALIKAIQERQNEIYSEENESKYLDYEFVLDRSTINKIRDYNKREGQNNYTKYVGETIEKNGITVYQSDLFRYGGKIYSSNNKLGTLGCNNQEGTRCESFTDDYVNTLRAARGNK